MNQADWRGGDKRPRVRDAVSADVHIEQGDPAALSGASRVAVIAHFARTAAVTRSMRELVGQFRTYGYTVAVVSSATTDGPLEWGGCTPDVVMRKPNLGYDFGSWSVGLGAFPGLTDAPRVILANDSMVGPLTDLRHVLDDFDTASADVWALTDTRQYVHHLQSYFVGYRDGVLADRPLREFWADIRHEATKWDIIRNNELGLSAMLRREGYLTGAMYTAEVYAPRGENPVISSWRRLVSDGFPFVKHELIRDRSVAADASLVPAVLETMRGIHVRDWI